MASQGSLRGQRDGHAFALAMRVQVRNRTYLVTAEWQLLALLDSLAAEAV